MFQLPTKMCICLFGKFLSSSIGPNNEFAPIRPCKKFLCLAFTVGIKCNTCAAIKLVAAKLFILAGPSSLKTVSCETHFSHNFVSSSVGTNNRLIFSSALLHLRNCPFPYISYHQYIINLKKIKHTQSVFGLYWNKSSVVDENKNCGTSSFFGAILASAKFNGLRDISGEL